MARGLPFEKRKLIVPLFVALLHHPVRDRNGELITASVTNLDLQDISRSSKTFGVERYFVVHPSPDEQALNRRIASHWKTGYGRDAHPTRSDALDIMELVASFDEVRSSVESKYQRKPVCVGTTARTNKPNILSIEQCQKLIENEVVILIFGTGYGLTDEFLGSLDYLLPPILGPGEFNHLSVRSAVAIYLDRLRGRRD
jgi:tRNA (guanine37-N1)-methyltransferase